MTGVKLDIEPRVDAGKANTKQLRRSGRVPAVVYGEGKEAKLLSLDAHSFEMMMKENHAIIELSFDGNKHQTIVREVQRHPVNGNILHVDFLEVKKGHKVTLSVNLHFEGKAKGEKEGGNFQTVKNEVEINVFPKDIPDFINIDISNLGLGENIRVKDIEHENFEILDDPEDVLCRVQEPRAVEEVEEELEEEEAAEPEVITARESEEETE